MNTPSQQSPAAPGCLAYGMLIVIGLWALAVVGLGQLGVWLVGQVLIATGGELPVLAAPIAAAVQALLVGAPALIYAASVRAQPLRAVAWLWLAASGCLALFGLVGALPYTQAQAASVAQIVVSGALLAVTLLAAHWRGLRLVRWRAPGMLTALALALLLGTPFVALGALGSPLDTLLNLLAGLGLGLLASALACALLLPPLQRGATGRGNTALGAFGLAVLLFVLGGGFGFDGSKLLLMLALPPLGVAALGLARRADGMPEQAWVPIGLLLGGVSAAPLLFFDPDELTILLGNSGVGDALGFGMLAAGLTFVLALVAGVLLLARRGERAISTPLAWGGLAGAALLALLLYVGVGQPGFYGEDIFVVLRDQADTSQATGIADRDERLRFVYTTLTEHADTTQADLRATLDRFGVGYQPYYLVNALRVDGGPLVRAYLSTRPEVERILDNPELRPLPAGLPVESGETSSAPSVPPWNITSIGADRVWRELGVTGEGIVVGQSDSGVQIDHPALQDGYRGRGGQNEYNWLDPWSHSSAPVDYGGHGTHTLGSVLGRGGIGVAPGAEWFACANLQRNLGDPAVYLDCMQFMLAPFPQRGDPLTDGNPALAAHVLNNSWGCPAIEGCDAEALVAATRALRDAGIFVVASAGNNGPQCSTVSDPIALYDAVFSVGAVDAAGDVVGFSSRGPVTVDGSGRPKPDIIAPGADVLSSLPNSTYGPNDGTSMAGPHVAGVVALMWSANPQLIGDIDRTEQILRETASPYRGAREGCFSAENGVSNAYGAGVVDAYAAVQAALAMTR